MTRKNPMGLGEDPLDALLPDITRTPAKENLPAARAASEQTTRRARNTRKTAQKRAGKLAATAESNLEIPGPKVTVSLHLPLKLIERVRDAAYYVPGLTVSGISETALRNELQHVEHAYEKTYRRTIPERTGKLSPGRPPKS